MPPKPSKPSFLDYLGKVQTGRVEKRPLPKNNKIGESGKTTQKELDNDDEMDVDEDVEMKNKVEDKRAAPMGPGPCDPRRLISFQGPGFYCTANGLQFDPELWHHVQSRTDTNQSYRIMLKPDIEGQTKLYLDTRRFIEDPTSRRLLGGSFVQVPDPRLWDYYRVRFVDNEVRLIPSNEIPTPSSDGPISEVMVSLNGRDESLELGKSRLQLTWGEGGPRTDTYEGTYPGERDRRKPVGGDGKDNGGVVETVAGRLKAIKREDKVLQEHMKNIVKMTEEVVSCIWKVRSGLQDCLEKELDVLEEKRVARGGMDDPIGAGILELLQDKRSAEFLSELEKATKDVLLHAGEWQQALKASKPGSHARKKRAKIDIEKIPAR